MAILRTIWNWMKEMVTNLFATKHSASIKKIMQMDDLLAQLLAIEEYMEEHVKHIKADTEQTMMEKKQAIKQEVMDLLQEL